MKKGIVIGALSALAVMFGVYCVSNSDSIKNRITKNAEEVTIEEMNTGEIEEAVKEKLDSRDYEKTGHKELDDLLEKISKVAISGGEELKKVMDGATKDVADSSSYSDFSIPLRITISVALFLYVNEVSGLSGSISPPVYG